MKSLVVNYVYPGLKDCICIKVNVLRTKEDRWILYERKISCYAFARFNPYSINRPLNPACIFVFGPNLLGSPTLLSSSVITNVGLPDQTKFILISRPA